MSTTKQTDLNNNLAARQRNEIHLLSKRQADAAGVPPQESAGALSTRNDSTVKPSNPSSTGERKPMAIVARRSVEG